MNSVTSTNTGELWYLKIDDKEFGPVSRAQLEYFLRPPRLCSMLQVMCTLDLGMWYLIGRDENLDDVLSRFGIEAPVQSKPEPVVMQGPGLIEQFLDGVSRLARGVVSTVGRFRVEASLVLALVALNVAFLYFTSDGLGRERQILQTFETLWSDVTQFNPESESKEAWREFADDAISELEPLIDELSSSTKTSPQRQRLLFIGREQLLAILKEETPAITDSRQADALKVQLKKAHETLAAQ